VSTLPAPPAPADPAFASEATVVVEGASVWFGPNVALNEVSCSFGPGVTGLLGPNGAGKTTLMRSICGMLPLNAGTVRVTAQLIDATNGHHVWSERYDRELADIFGLQT
jgi:ABC-type multidrug transport system ATPase subunit